MPNKHEVQIRVKVGLNNSDICYISKIFYQVTKTAGPGDLVSARDWFLISRIQMRGNVWFQGGCSVEYPGGPTGAILLRFFPIRLRLKKSSLIFYKKL